MIVICLRSYSLLYHIPYYNILTTPDNDGGDGMTSMYCDKEACGAKYYGEREWKAKTMEDWWG